MGHGILEVRWLIDIKYCLKLQMYEESKDRIINLTDRLERLQLDQDRIAAENRVLADEKRNLDCRLNKTEGELNVCEMTKEHLRNDKSIVSLNYFNDPLR